jgi:hypothetical protein
MAIFWYCPLAEEEILSAPNWRLALSLTRREKKYLLIWARYVKLALDF